MKRRTAIVLGLVGTASIGACGRSDVLYKDDQYGAHGARGGGGGSGGTGAHTGGTNFTGGTGGTGASFSGGTGAGPGKGGSFGTGGTGGGFGTGGTVVTGGAGGKGGTGGSSGSAGAAGMGGGPYACQHTVPTCDTFTNFSTDQSVTWGSGAFTGGVVVFGNGITRDMATDRVHVTGKVSDYSNGVIIYFATCADLSKYAGVYFTLAGRTGFNDEIQIMPWTNSDYPWQEDPKVMRGGCTTSNPMNPFADCQAPELLATLYSSRQYAYWSDFSGGSPVVWNSASSPSEIVGVQWLFPFDPTFGSYEVDVTLDDVGFIRSGTAAPDCGPAIGTGGMGGVAGMAGMSGMSGVGGFAGTSAGGAGAGGIGGFNAGGSSTGGFSAGGFSAGGFSAGGFSAGGFSTAGESAGGVATGGQSVGGQATGGEATGGLATGGQPTAGIGGS
jgi:hypothetical protein